MNKKKRILFIVVGLTIISAIAFFGLVTKMLVENGKCVDNPFGYSAQKLEESGGNYLCSCNSLDPELLDFNFDKDGIRILEEEEISFSNIKIG